MKGKDDESRYLRHIPPPYGVSEFNSSFKTVSLSFNIKYNLEKQNKFMAPSELNKSHIYAMDKYGRSYSPFWYTLNIFAQWVVNSHFSSTFAVENILDKRYRPYSSGIVASGRNLVLGLKYMF